MAKIYKIGRFIGSEGIGGNSVSVSDGDFVSKVGGFIVKSTAGVDIEGIAAGEQEFASDNQTVAQSKVSYLKSDDYAKYRVVVGGQTITFSGALVTSNKINLKVNGVAMTEVDFTSDDATTLAAIATQIETDFSDVVESATAGTNSVIVNPIEKNADVVITDVVVTAGSSQATAVITADGIAQTDEGKYYDIEGSIVDGTTASASTGQLKLEKYENSTQGIFSVVNK